MISKIPSVNLMLKLARNNSSGSENEKSGRLEKKPSLRPISRFAS